MASMPAAEAGHPYMSANVLDHPDLRIKEGVLVFPMPVEAYDCLMNHEMLPCGACYNREAMEVEAMPNGREHDPRGDAVYALFVLLRELSGIPIHAGTSLPLQTPPDRGGDRRHPDAYLYVEQAKIERLHADKANPIPAPDVVVEVDYTPLSRTRYRERLDAYARIGVREVWTWTRTGDPETGPKGRTTFHMAVGDGYMEAPESNVVPGMRTADMEALMREPLDQRRTAMARELAERLAPHIAVSPLFSRP